MRFLHEKFRPTTSALNRVVTHAYQRNPFYREKISASGVALHQINDVEDLSLLPFTTREELQSDPWRLLAVPRDSLVQAHISTGTTGRSPVYIVYDWEDLYTRGLMPLVAEKEGPKLLRIEQGETVFNALPYEVSVTGMAIHRSVQDGVGACIVPLGKGGFYSEPAKTLKMMRQIQGDHLFTTPSYAVYLAELALRTDIDVKAEMGLRSIWLIGELCSPALRKRIEAYWGCPAYLYYGSMESGPIGVECALQDGYHVATNFSAVEVVPVDGQPEGVGEVVVTPLWRYASPLIRYRTGDLARWVAEPCKCGLPGHRLHVLGRMEDIITVSGRSFHCMDVEQILLQIPEVSSWFRLKIEPDLMRVLLPSPAAGDEAALKRTVLNAISKNLQIETVVEFVEQPHYSGGKFLRVIRSPAETPS